MIHNDIESNVHHDLYEEVKESLKFLSTSGVRMKIVLSLDKRSKKTSELRNELGLNSSTIIHAMNELEKRNFIFKEGENYILSQTGKILTLKLIDVIKTIAAVNRHEKLWLDHEIGDIPEDLLKNIGDLSDSTLVESTPTDLAKNHATLMQLLSKAKEIRAISPVFHSDYAELLKKSVNKGIIFQPIVTNEVLKALIKEIGQEILEDLLSRENFTLWVTEEDVKLAFAITDSFTSLGLFRIDGSYNYDRDLISRNENAIRWGAKLFERYLEKSKRVK